MRIILAVVALVIDYTMVRSIFRYEKNLYMKTNEAE
jgi:hypothetical protein